MNELPEDTLRTMFGKKWRDSFRSAECRLQEYESLGHRRFMAVYGALRQKRGRFAWLRKALYCAILQEYDRLPRGCKDTK